VKELKGKPFVSFVSHGGGGGAIESLQKLGKAVGLNAVSEGLKVQGAPTGESVKACRALGRTLSQALD